MLLLLFCLLTGCQEIDPRTIYTQAQKKTSALSSGERTIQLELVIDPEGSAKTYSWDMTARFLREEKQTKLAIESENTFPERSFSSQSLYDGSTIYINDNGQKYRAQMEYSVLQQRISRVYPSLEISVSQMKELTSKTRDGGQEFQFAISAGNVESLRDFVMSQIENFSTDIPTEFTVEKSEGMVWVNQDGYIASTTLQIPCAVLYHGEELEAEMTYQEELVSPGQQVKIEMTNPEEYPEVTMWDLPW